MNRQPGTMEPPRLRDAGASPRLDKLAPSGSRPGCGLDEQHTGHHPPGCRLLRMPGAAARLAVASPPCRYMITRPAVLDACWSRPVARWLDAGAAARLRGWAAASGHQPRGLMLDPHRNQPPRFTNSLKQRGTIINQRLINN